MKKLKSILITILLIIPLISSAQEKKNLIKTSLVFPFADMFLIAYERPISDQSSLQLEITLGEIFSIRPEYRFYMSETRIAPSGAFVAPYAQFVDENVGAGILVGYQRLFKSKISLEAFAGPGFYTEGVGGWGGINLGIAF